MKALSPAINDPTTAVLAIDQIHRLLRVVGKRQLRGETINDERGALRVIYRTPNWEDFVHLACTEIRSCGAGNVQVARRLRAMLENLIASLPPHRHGALEEERRRLERVLEPLYSLPEDLALARIPDSQGLGGSSGTTSVAVERERVNNPGRGVSARRHERPAGRRFPHRNDEVGAKPRLRDVADAANRLGGQDELFILVDGEKHHGGRRTSVAERLRDLETGHPRHRNVEHDDVRLQGPGGFERRGPVLRVPTTTQADVSTAAARASIASLSSTRRTRGRSDNVVLDGILDQFCGRLDFQLFHHSVFVKGHRPRREVQEAGDLLHRMTFGEQLQHFPLPRRQFVGRLAVDVQQRRQSGPR